MIPRILNLQGAVGIAASLLLLGLFGTKAGEARHWHKQSSRFEQLYLGEQSARAGTVANYRAAAKAARAADLANFRRVAVAQRSITERSTHDLEARLAAARLSAQRLQLGQPAPATAQRGGRTAALSATGPTAGAAGGAAKEVGFSLADRLIATEQAIQLDELIRWVNDQAAVGSGETEPR